jgi:uncharacterized phage infection (PIP) family protein YhgE
MSEENSDKKAESLNKEEGSKTGEGYDAGVVIPEDFQKDVHAVLQKASTKHHLSHIRDRVYAKEDEMRKAEMKSKKGVPDTYSTDAAPQSLGD